MSQNSTQFGTLTEFDDKVEPWANYMERVELFFSANDTPEDKRLPALLCSIGKRNYGLLRNLVAPEPITSKSYAEVVGLFREYFAPKPLVIAERFRFYKREQEPSETISEYVAALRRLSEYCVFGSFLNEALRDRFVCGLRSSNLQKRLLSEVDLTFSKATEIAIAVETAFRNADELQGKLSLQENIHRFTPSHSTGATHSTVKAAASSLPSRIVCYRCGDIRHKANSCRFANVICHGCNKKGHLKKVCQAFRKTSTFTPATSRPPQQKGKSVRLVSTERQDEIEAYSKANDLQVRQDLETINWNSVNVVDVQTVSHNSKSFWVTPIIQGVPVRMEIDTGSAVSIIPESIYTRHFLKFPIQPVQTIFKTYSGEQLKPLGKIHVQVVHNGQEDLLDLYVLKDGIPLFGREWLYAIRINWEEIFSLQSDSSMDGSLQELLSKYQDLFDDTLGVLKGTKAKLYVKKDAQPVFCKARPVPFSLRPQVEKELDRLENEGIISRVKFSDWATPIVPVPKPDGSVRICGDFKVTVNPSLHIEQFPLPKIEEIFANLAGGQRFSKIDLKHAYLQMEMEETSKKFLTINTHRGLFQYNRLAFGIASAPAIWQKTVNQIFQDCPKSQGRLDDILVTGNTDSEHLQNLQSVFQRLRDHGLRVNKDKCEFFKKEVVFCGHKIDKNGLHKTQDKIEAVLQTPRPTSVTELRSFLGLVNYYGKFFPNYSTHFQPLFQLLKQGQPWTWTAACEQAFQEAKNIITSDIVLVHYSPALPLCIACDASPHGLGCVLSHVMPDGTERPIAFASRSLSETEKKNIHSWIRKAYPLYGESSIFIPTSMDAISPS